MRDFASRARVNTTISFKMEEAELLDEMSRRFRMSKAELVVSGVRLLAGTVGKVRLDDRPPAPRPAKARQPAKVVVDDEPEIEDPDAELDELIQMRNRGELE